MSFCMGTATLVRKAMEGTSQELEVNSSSKKLSGFENLIRTASSSERLNYDGSGLVSKTSQDSNIKQSTRFSKKFLKDARASGSNKTGRELVVSCSRGRNCSYSFKGKDIFQETEVEQLSERLKILEDETEAIKQVFIETMEARKKLMNEIYQDFLSIHHCDHLGKRTTGLKSLNEPLIVNASDKFMTGIGLSQILCEDSNPCTVTRDHRANVHIS